MRFVKQRPVDSSSIKHDDANLLSGTQLNEYFNLPHSLQTSESTQRMLVTEYA